MERLLIMIGLLFSGLLAFPVQAQNQDEEVPSLTYELFSFDLNGHKDKIMDYLNFVDEDELGDILKIWELFDIEWEHLGLSGIDWKLKDFIDKKKKKIKLLESETYLWLENVLLSGQLTKFITKAHQVYNLVVDREKKLHEKFLEGLGIVSSGVLNAQVAITYVNNVVATVNRIRRFKAILNDNQLLLSAEEYAFFLTALANALNYQQQLTDDFNLLTTNDKLKMTDGQRLKTLEKFNTIAEQTNLRVVKLTELLGYILARRAGQMDEYSNLEQLITP
ncbi:MAG: hypothetical protein RIG62_18320 [Cyclobacteriaceae bacterium]